MGKIVMNARPGLHGPDKALVLIVFILLIFGLVMLYSASYGLLLAAKADRPAESNPEFYLLQQAKWAIMGLAILILLALVDYHRWQKVSLLFLIAVIALMGAALIIGKPIGDTRAWLQSGSGQPAELAKLALVLYMAAWLPQKGEGIRNFKQGAVPFGVVVGLVGGLVFLQGDFGTGIILVTTAAAVFFLAGADLGQLMLAAIAGGSTLVLMIKLVPGKMDRLYYWWDPCLAGSDDRTYQMCQALIAMSSGGLRGLGFGNGLHKFWVPLPHQDTIFSVIGEELGMVGAITIMALFGFLFYRGIRVALAAPDRFGSLLAAGITCWIIIQALVHMGVMTASLPPTGVTLPFFSYGGSSLIAVMAGVGLLISVSRQTIDGESR